VSPRVCVACGGRAVQRHHVLSRQALKKLARDATERRRLIEDERNLVWVCVPCHMRHENAFRRLSFSVLPQEALDFAEEVGLMHLIDRFYPREEAG
jgi:hypothetical protein